MPTPRNVQIYRSKLNLKVLYMVVKSDMTGKSDTQPNSCIILPSTLNFRVFYPVLITANTI